MNAILFDCDGTLADSFGLIVGTMQRTFERSGLPVPDAKSVHGVIGLSLDLAIHRLTPTTSERDVPALVECYRTTFHAIRAEGTTPERLFDGIEPLLRQLARRDDLLLGLVTGKSRRGVSHVIETHSLEHIFQAVRTADDCPSKPHPAMVLECCAELDVAPARTIVVGDAIFDMAMARNAGAAAIGVDWGAASRADLVDAGAGAVAASTDELADLLTAWADTSAALVPAN